MSPCDIDLLTVGELISLVKNHLSLPREVRLRKERVVAHIKTYATEELLAVIEAAAMAKFAGRKRQREDNQTARRLERRLEREVERSPEPANYLKLPDEEETRRCYEQFYVATGMDALRTMVCGVCAREVRERDDGVERIKLDSLPYRARLHPREPHPNHELYEGCLLEPAGVSVTEKGIVLNICRSCRDDLKRDASEPPKFSLANNLWIGKVPEELAVLTVPEQMLVAQLFPRVYVFKLFPKTPGFRPTKGSLQRAMRGTVSTYELDTQGIASMADGDLLPRPPSVLASVISVTFVGIGTLPKRWLRYTFRVRREVVRRALRRLQGDHRHYGHITISEERLTALPEDDVPEELLSVVRQCHDAGASVQEGAGYVPRDDEDDDEFGGSAPGGDWGEEEQQRDNSVDRRGDVIDEDVEEGVCEGTLDDGFE